MADYYGRTSDGREQIDVIDNIDFNLGKIEEHLELIASCLAIIADKMPDLPENDDPT